MLGRRKRLIEDVSMGIDMVAAVVLLTSLLVVSQELLPWFNAVLQKQYGYPVRALGYAHLLGQLWLFALVVLCLFAALRITKFHETDLMARWQDLAFGSLKSVALGLGLTVFLLYLLKFDEFNRSLLIFFGVTFWCYHVTKEWFLRRYLLDHYYMKNPLEAILVAPVGKVVERLKQMEAREYQSVRITAIALSDGYPSDLPPSAKGLFKGRYADLATILASGRYDLVFLGLSRGNVEIAQNVLDQAEEQGVEVWYFADFVSPQLCRPQIDEYAGQPIIVFPSTRALEGHLFIKRIFDLVVSTFALIFLSPLLLLTAILVKFSSPGPVFFRQQRTGWKGRAFSMFKFRTMYIDAEKRRVQLEAQNEMSGPVFKSREDPRITPVGRILRRYSIDELPQLINVFKGDMSLVGPRPLPIYETAKFEAYRDRRRLSLPPGITGLWQVSGRSDITDFNQWVSLDLEYIDGWSFWLDLRILLRTIPVVLTGQGAR